MPITNEKIFQKIQAGTESTPGTGVATTRIMYTDFSFTYDRPIQEFPDHSGSFNQRRRVAYGRPQIGFSGSDMVTFEDFPLWLEAGAKGGVTPSGDGGSPVAYTRTYTPSLTADDLKSWTIEFNEPGNVYKSTQFRLNEWTLRVDPDNTPAWMFDWTGYARDFVASTFTGAIADRNTEAVLAAGTLAYIDSTTIGSTQATGKVIDYSLACQLNTHMKAFMEDNGTWAANKVGRGPRTFDATMQLEFDGDTEFANYRSATAVQRKIRIKRSGSQIHGGTPINNSAQVDVYGYWRSIGFGDRDGNLTATFGLQAFYDSTAATDVSIVVIDSLATLP